MTIRIGDNNYTIEAIQELLDSLVANNRGMLIVNIKKYTDHSSEMELWNLALAPKSVLREQVKKIICLFLEKEHES